jgi:Domain of unknown function (DUF4832)/Domain of unknown function (DUF4874)
MTRSRLCAGHLPVGYGAEPKAARRIPEGVISRFGPTSLKETVMNIAPTTLRRSGAPARLRAWVTATALATGLTLALTVLAAPTEAAAGPVTYVPSTATFANPERGLFRQPNCDAAPLDVAWMTTWRTTQNVSLARCVFYLGEFKGDGQAISAAKLSFIQSQTNAVKAAGLKLIVRFAYTQSTSGDDAKRDTVLGHIDQLAPYFRNNSDVIDVVESGFVGAWGEGYYTQNFGNRGAVSMMDWSNRKAVVTKLLSVVPTTRMVLMRTPLMKRQMYGPSPVTSAAAYNGSALARVGHHNDCFLASPDDQGTYQDPAVEYPYLQADTTYVAMGGETCALNRPRSDCPTARQELAMFHYSYLNRDYNAAVMQSWRDGGCMTEVEQRLGYRFALVASLFPASVTPGSTILAQIFVRNTGFATPHNLRRVWLVLRNTSTGTTSRVRLITDPRRWAPGTTTAITQTIGTLPTMQPGTYELLLSLPDSSSTLAARPEYAIRMANTGVWDASTGYNRLLTTIIVR